MIHFFQALQLIGALGLQIALLLAGLDILFGGRLIHATPAQAGVVLGACCGIALVGWLGIRHCRRRAEFKPRAGQQ